jgi:tetratricopeptide (TPR) repeat protein
MPRRYFNWKLAIVLFISVTVLGITAFGLRKWRSINSSEKGLELGNKAFNDQNWEEAAKELGRYIAVNQNDVDVLMKYAEAQTKIRPSAGSNIMQAAQSYRAVLRIESQNLEAAQQLIKLYILMGRFGDAELIAERFLEGSQDPEIKRMYAIALVNQRKFSEAAETLKKLCAENPKEILAYETTGQLAEQHPEEFSDSAVRWFDEAVKNNPSSALAYVIRAGYYRRNNNITLALSDLEKAEMQELSKPEVCLRLASEYINLNLLDKAEKIFAKVREIAPEDQGLWQLSAQAALMSKSPEKMKETAQAGLKELSSQPWDFMPLAAELFIRSGEFEKASDYISQLNQKNFEPARISYLEGLLAAAKGDFSNAAKRWEYSIESGNNSTIIRLELASALSNLGDMQSAVNQLRALISERPDSFDGYLALAKVLAQIGNWPESLKQAEKATQLNPANSDAILLYMQALIQTSGSGSGIAQNLQNVETLLSKLNSAGTDSLEIELIRFQLDMRKGNYTSAQGLTAQLKQKYPEQISVYLAEAELYAAQDKLNEAVSILRQTIEKFPDAIGPVKYLAALLDLQNNKDECVAVITETLSRIKEPIIQRDLTFMLVSFYNRWDMKDKAYELLESISKKFPDDIPIKRQLLLCEQVIAKPDKAQKIADDIKSLEGEDGWQWRYEQTRIWYLSDNFKEYYPGIVSLIQKNMLTNPNDQASRFLLAKTYEKAGEMQLAITTYREALNKSPDNIQILTNLVSALYKIREYGQAEELLKFVPKQSMQNTQLQKLQLQNYLRQGQIESASNILQDFIGNDPNNQEAGLALALLDMQQGKFTESEQLLVKLKAGDPASLTITAAQIQLNLRQEKPQEAIKICDEYINSYKSASAYILRARTYASLNQTDKALSDLNSAVASEPENAQLWMTRSEFYSSINMQDKAIEDILKAMSLNPNDEQIQKHAIVLFLTSGKQDLISEGKTIIDKALNKNPDDIDLNIYKANTLLTSGTSPGIESAKQILQRITEEKPEISKAWLMLGEIMLKKGQPGTAMDYASRGLAYKSNDEDLLFLKARAESVRSPVLAVPTLKVLCDLNPDNIEAVTFLVNTYITTNEPGKAVSFLQNILSKCKSSNTRTYNISLAAALYKAGSKTDAQTKLNSLMEENPNDPAPFLAQIYLLKDDKVWDELKNKALEWYGKHPENSHIPAVIAGSLISTESEKAKSIAEEIFREILKNNSNNSEALYSLAILLSTSGRSQEAADLYRKLLDVEPDNIVAINNLAWIMCENLGQPQQALDLAQKGLALNPDYTDLIDTRGMVYYRLGKFDKAVQDFKKCIELYLESSPQSVASKFHLAKAYIGLKENAKAIEYLKAVLDSDNKKASLTPEELIEAQNLLRQQ